MSYRKNHWTKHKLVCIQFDAFYMLIPNMCSEFLKSDLFKIFDEKLKMSTARNICSKRVTKVGMFDDLSRTFYAYLYLVSAHSYNTLHTDLYNIQMGCGHEHLFI